MKWERWWTLRHGWCREKKKKKKKMNLLDEIQRKAFTVIKKKEKSLQSKLNEKEPH